jgi:hypothetical protein
VNVLNIFRKFSERFQNSLLTLYQCILTFKLIDHPQRSTKVTIRNGLKRYKAIK